MFHSINPEHAARTIEQQHPEIKDNLISWLQLTNRDPSGQPPRGVLAFVGRFAIRNLNSQDAVSVVDSATVVRLGAAFFGCLICSLIYLFASPKSGLTSIARMMMPWSNIASAARVQVIDVLPGSTTITQGSSVPVSVTVRGMYKGEGMTIRYGLSDSQAIGERIKMSPEIEAGSYKLLFGKNFGGIHQPLRYRVEAGDSVAGPFDVGVQVVPLVAIDRIELGYPSYTRLKPSNIARQGSFEGPEGTVVKLFASSNQPMMSIKGVRPRPDPFDEVGLSTSTIRSMIGRNIYYVFWRRVLFCFLYFFPVSCCPQRTTIV